MRSMELGDEEDKRLEEIWITILRRLTRTISRTPSGIPEYHPGPPKTPPHPRYDYHPGILPWMLSR